MSSNGLIVFKLYWSTNHTLMFIYATFYKIYRKINHLLVLTCKKRGFSLQKSFPINSFLVTLITFALDELSKRYGA